MSDWCGSGGLMPVFLGVFLVATDTVKVTKAACATTGKRTHGNSAICRRMGAFWAEIGFLTQPLLDAVAAVREDGKRGKVALGGPGNEPGAKVAGDRVGSLK